MSFANFLRVAFVSLALWQVTEGGKPRKVLGAPRDDLTPADPDDPHVVEAALRAVQLLNAWRVEQPTVFRLVEVVDALEAEGELGPHYRLTIDIGPTECTLGEPGSGDPENCEFLPNVVSRAS